MKNEYFDTKTNGLLPTNLPGGFFVYEATDEEKIVFAGPNIVDLYGCDTYEEFIEFVGGTFRGMVHPDDLHTIENQIQAQTLYGEKRHDYVRYRILNKQGEEHYVEDFGHLMHAINGKSYFYVFIVDVDLNEYQNRNRNSLAEAQVLTASQETDGLTGLLNMSFFYQHVQAYLNSSDSWRDEISFIHFDIPNFKLFNERNGFVLGDELLCDLAKALVDTFEGSIISRFSDDHFVVCAKGDQDEIVKKVEHVYKILLQNADVNKRVRIKAGIYYLEDRRSEIGLACDHARLACNSIKSRHDINYCIYDELLRDDLRKQQFVIDHVDEAIEKEYIKVFYQPVIRVQTGEICGYEALVRWDDPDYGMLCPGEFIETLEQYHLIHLVDSYVIKRVCKDYCELRDAGEDLVPVSINISRMDFELCDIFNIVEATRAEYDVPRHMLDLEITESAVSDSVKFIQSECARMRDMGYHIWIDDFGSGYSSLNTIAEYEFDVLKLDMVFLRSYDRNERTGKVITYVIKAAKAMGNSPLCEGVETEAHFQFLKEIGCERAQGYFFGRPMPMAETRSSTKAKGMVWEKVEE